MKEFSPQFTYSPATDTLNFHTILDDDLDISQKQLEVAERLSEEIGVETEHEGAEVIGRVEVSRALGKCFNNSGDERLTAFIRSVDKLLFSEPPGHIDRVA